MNLDPDLYVQAHYNRAEADWDKLYENYTAAVDIPTWIWYKELMEKYPDAKVILTMRDPDSWYKSVKRIHAHSEAVIKTIVPTEPLQKRIDMADVIINKSELLNPETFVDEEYTKALYLKHYQEVMEKVPEEKLLVMELGEGWDRLCKFLGKEVPEVPYPKVNSGDEFESFINGMSENPDLAEKKLLVS
jgi:hypothetical protein